MEFNESILQKNEIISLMLRELYMKNGYTPYRMSKFEEYDLYAKNKDFLVSDNVITFTDTNGKLMALKPDVTLSIIKNTEDDPNALRKVFYNENIYRIAKSTGAYKEIMQVGAEAFGKVDEDVILNTLQLAAESLKIISPDAVLAISNIDLMNTPLAAITLSQELRSKLNGPVKEVLPRLDAMLGCNAPGSSTPFCSILTKLAESPDSAMFVVDFSVTDDINYYNGMVFKGYVKGIPEPVLSGGQYDRLMTKLGRKSSAIGFAVYTDGLDRLDPAADSSVSDDYLNIALPKGRLGEKVYAMFEKAGYECPAVLEPGRKLIFENPEKGVRYFWVKPSDVAKYVERGAADLGVAGKDILLEYQPDIFELADLKTGICRMAVAAPEGFTDDTRRTLRVATKFANIARNYYQSRGRDIDIIYLNGSIEIAPILGLSDVIVDIVETGTTLRENHLEVIDEVCPISARLIANKASFKFKNKRIEAVAKSISSFIQEE